MMIFFRIAWFLGVLLVTPEFVTFVDSTEPSSGDTSGVSGDELNALKLLETLNKDIGKLKAKILRYCHIENINVSERRYIIKRSLARIKLETVVAEMSVDHLTRFLIDCESRISKVKTTITQPTTTSTTILPTEWSLKFDDTAFEVLDSKNLTKDAFDLLFVRVRLPHDGMAKSENWCRDYQHLCEHFKARPTGCPHNSFKDVQYAHRYESCGELYNSDQEVTALKCAPNWKIAEFADIAFPDIEYYNDVSYHNAIGFFRCTGEYSCDKSFYTGKLNGLTGMQEYRKWNYIGYAVCSYGISSSTY